MATLSTGYTWQSGDLVTPALLNQTVNSANITNIANADVASNAAIALSKLGTGALPEAITVASANIVNDTIVNADISPSAAIALSKLATGALPTGITVASANLVDGTIVAADIASDAVTTAKINNAAVTAAKLDGAQTGSAPIFGVRAWCYFNGALTGTNAPIAGGNVTSVTRTNAGAYTINFTTAMPSSNYAVVANALTSEGGGNGVNQFVTGVPLGTTQAIVYVVDATVVFEDAQQISVFVIG